MTTKKLDKIGSWTAILIGTPIGLIFSFFAFLLSLFPPFDLILFATGGGLLWHPFVFALLIPITFMLLLWFYGKDIVLKINKNYSLKKTSFIFTLNVNKWLFSIILILFIISGLTIDNPTIDRFTSVCVGVIFTLLTFSISTFVTTYTIGLLIVKETKKKYSSTM